MGIPRRLMLTGLAVVTMLAAPVAAVAAEPEGTVLGAGGATAVAESYIVVFKDSSVSRAGVGTAAAKLSGRHGARIGRTYTAALGGVEIKANATTAKRIAADPSVAYVEQNHTLGISGTQFNPPSWGLDRIDQRNLPLNNSYGYPNVAGGPGCSRCVNVHAYILDTGIRFSHADFAGRASSGYDAIDGGIADDCNGHGTHVAGTVGGSSYGVAKAVQLVAVRVLDCTGSGTYAQVIDGINWVTAHAVKPAVANMSLGGVSAAAIDTAVTNSINSGVTYAVAAGNGDSSGRPQNACNASPARVPGAITVGATTSSDTAASFSNVGRCVDILAPGVNITSAWNTHDAATRTISGTSMATPHVTGAAALVLAERPSWRPQRVRNFLVANATSNVITNVGAGTPNKLLYVVNKQLG